MKIDCVIKNITKAGIRAETNEENTPMIIFIARDHYYGQNFMGDLQENDNIIVRIIGTRFELNDKYISVIADFVQKKNKKKKKIILKQ